VCVCQREVAQPCSARNRSYASASMSDSASLGSESRTRTIHPSPYGSVFTVSGASTRARLISTTFLGRLEVDELAERILREPRDPEGRLVAVDSRPVVLRVVAKVAGVLLSHP